VCSGITSSLSVCVPERLACEAGIIAARPERADGGGSATLPRPAIKPAAAIPPLQRFEPDPRRLRCLACVVALLTVVTPLAAATHIRAATASAAARPAADRLNVVMILTDDERAGLDRPVVRRLLGAQGVTFTNAFVTTSECCPSRAGILTGQYSHHNGVVGNAGANAYPAFDETSSLAVWLHDAGYETALVGKYLNGYPVSGEHHVPAGWTSWQAIDSTSAQQRYYDYDLNENGRLVHYGNAPDDYSTRVLTGKAVDFVEGAKRPFFLYFAPIAPHLPATPPPDAQAAATPPAPAPSFDEVDLGDKPWRGLHPRPLRPGAISFLEHSIRDRQLESLQAVDRSVEEIVAALKARHLLDRTVIVYASDNGFLWGEHRLGGKVWPYEESIRVPLVVRTPWRSVWGRTDSHLVLNIDLASTIAALAAVRPGLPQDGRSIVPLLRGEDPRWRSGFVVEYLGNSLLGQGGPPPFRGLRTKRYLYVEYENGWRELYDLAGDPWEQSNVAGSPAYARVQTMLARRLKLLFRAPPRLDAFSTGAPAG
jgi:N-acetylglucosamine-6-sulfatase